MFSAPADVWKGVQVLRNSEEGMGGRKRESFVNVGMAASMIVCGACLCSHGFSTTVKTCMEKNAVAEAKAAGGKACSTHPPKPQSG